MAWKGMPKRAAASADVDENENAWREEARTLLRVEQRRQNLTYAEIAKRMQAIGIEESEVSVRNKISRGTFPATFMLQFMHVLGIRLIPFRPQLTGEITLPSDLLESLPQVRVTPEMVAALLGTPKKG